LDSCIEEPPTPEGEERKERKNPRPLKGGKKEKNGCPG